MLDSLGVHSTLPSRLSATRRLPSGEADQLPRCGGLLQNRMRGHRGGTPETGQKRGSSGSTSGHGAPG
eukprot:7477019-Alexandrium_andersonii.AAC.1